MLMRLRDVERFRAAMTDAQLSRASLASMVGCSKSMVGHLRRGKYRTNIDLAARIEVALRVPLGTYFEPALVEDESDAA